MRVSLNIRSLLLALLFIVSLWSCSEDVAKIEDTLADGAFEFCINDENYDPNFTGTTCCVQRNSELSFTEPITYEYFTNLPDAAVSWEVISGDMEIVSDANSKTVSIRLGDSFTGGEISGRGLSGDPGFELACGASVVIEYMAGE